MSSRASAHLAALLIVQNFTDQRDASRRATVVRPGAHVQPVVLVPEDHEAVEILTALVEAVLHHPPGHGAVSEAMHHQRQPGCELGLLKVTPDSENSCI